MSAAYPTSGCRSHLAASSPTPAPPARLPAGAPRPPPRLGGTNGGAEGGGGERAALIGTTPAGGRPWNRNCRSRFLARFTILPTRLPGAPETSRIEVYLE